MNLITKKLKNKNHANKNTFIHIYYYKKIDIKRTLVMQFLLDIADKSHQQDIPRLCTCET